MEKNLRTYHFARTRDLLKQAITPDHFIIQTIHTIEELDQIIQKMIMLLRERYGPYAPKRVKDATTETLLTLINERATDDLGIAITNEDYAPIKHLADTLATLVHVRTTQEQYLDTLMHTTCPHLRMIAGPLIGARLINLAGSLKHLAELPSSTVQVLGAEKALFRHIKTGAKAPRFGILFAHEAISRAKENERGKTARKLANKIAIAAKQDYFGRP